MTLTEYIDGTLGSWKTNLGWTSTEINFIIAKTLLAYGVAFQYQATDEKKLFALAEIETWKKVKKEVAQDFKFSELGASYDRNQVFEQVQVLLDDAVSAGMVYLDGWSINIGEMTFVNDPYTV